MHKHPRVMKPDIVPENQEQIVLDLLEKLSNEA